MPGGPYTDVAATRPCDQSNVGVDLVEKVVEVGDDGEHIVERPTDGFIDFEAHVDPLMVDLLHGHAVLVHPGCYQRLNYE